VVAERWRIDMFGGLKAQRGGLTLTGFRSKKTGILLAYLAYHQGKPYTRTALIKLLWPEEIETLWSEELCTEKGRGYLRVALNALRNQLEPHGMAKGSVLLADRTYVSLEPTTIITDVSEFKSALQTPPDDLPKWIEALIHAVELYRGELLSGYEVLGREALGLSPAQEWILQEREQLAGNSRQALIQLSKHFIEQKDYSRARHYAYKLVEVTPLREKSHINIISRYLSEGRYSEALHHYEEMVRLFREGGKQLSEKMREDGEKLRSVFRNKVATQSVSFPLTRLPLPFTPFFGREQEIAYLQRLLLPNEHPDFTHLFEIYVRLVTLTGPGGIGKTRLALKVTERLKPAYNHAVWFVSLADLEDASQISRAIVETIGLQPSPTLEPLEQSIRFFNSRTAPALLILDNFEHLVEPGVAILLGLLTRVPSLKLLVTSRQSLALSEYGEQEFPVPPLPFPEQTDTPEKLLEFPSVQLYTSRAQRARPDFLLTTRNASDVSALCQRLEGIPLAIELAAARARIFTPAESVTQFEQSLDLLVSQHKELPIRHRALRTTIDWSYRLLAPTQKQFFTRLSVFRGGWSAEAAASVCEETSAQECLTQLRVHSLIIVEEVGKEMRFRMLEPLREYAAEQMEEGERVDRTRRHASYYRHLAEITEPSLTGSEQAAGLERLAREHENLNAALAWASESDIDAGLRLAGSLGEYWQVRGHLAEGRRWFGTFLDKGQNAPTEVRAKALSGAGNLALLQGDYAQTRSFYDRSLALWQELGDRKQSGQLFNNLGNLALSQGEYASAQAYYATSLAIGRKVGNKPGISRSLNNLGKVAYEQGDNALARSLYEQSLAGWRELEDRLGIATLLSNLGAVAQEEGDYELASARFLESLASRKELADAQGLVILLFNLGTIALLKQEYATARSRFVECLHKSKELRDIEGIIQCLEAMGELAFSQDHFERAMRLFGAAEALRRSSNIPMPPPQLAEYEQLMAQIRAEVNAQMFEAALKEGHAMNMEMAVAYALETEEEPDR
jgi:predicted ATPase/DNA-binding SARP family transcriptional activator